MRWAPTPARWWTNCWNIAPKTGCAPRDALLKLAETYSQARLEAACARAWRFADPSYRTIKRILQQGLDQQAPPETAAPPPAKSFARSAQELMGHLLGGDAMELRHQLSPYLKQLRLSGILETLEARNQQAVDGQWSYIEFLSRLLEDEVARRAQKQLTRRIRRAAINTTKTLEGFDFSFNPALNRQRILDLATCTYIRQHRNVLLCGPTGTGKTQPC